MSANVIAIHTANLMTKINNYSSPTTLRTNEPYTRKHSEFGSEDGFILSLLIDFGIH